MAGPKEKKIAKRISNTTSKVATPTKENLQRSRSKDDGPSTKKESRGKNSGSVARNKMGGISKAAKKNPTGRGTEVSNKALEKRTKRDMKSTLKARKSDESDAAKKKATKTAAKKTVAKSIAKKIPGVGLAVTVLDAVTTRKKSTTGRTNAAKKNKKK